VHLYEKSDVARPAAAVWPFVATAERFKEWNRKVVSLDASGPFRLGQTFATHYLMGGKASQCVTTVTALETGRLLELTHANFFGDGISPRLSIRERITLTEKGGRTLVDKDVDIPASAFPWYWVPLIWFIVRFGRSVEPDRLKALCEAAP
jgi:hypothetical protein